MILTLVILTFFLNYVKCEYIYSEDGKCVEDDVIATCVHIKNCPGALQRVIAKNKTQICSFEGIDPVVCCKEPKLEPVVDKRNEDEDACILKQRMSLNLEENGPTLKCHEYRKRLLYPCTFNESSGLWYEEDFCTYPERATSGYRLGAAEEAERHQFRHMALLLYGEEIQLDLFCGGSVISERFILTAAHCASAPTRGAVTTAVTGILKLSDPQELWRKNRVKMFHQHYNYVSPKKYYDIAVLETEEEILLDARVVPICLHSEEDDDFGAKEAVATGWGALGPKQPFADNLKNVRLTQVVTCLFEFGPHRNRYHGYDDASMLCFGRDDNQTVDTCQGDSGGPLQLKTGPCEYLVIGVTSFGKRCATLGVPAVYTRVSFYFDWIQSIVWP